MLCFYLRYYRTKLDPHDKKCIFLLISRNADFYEFAFPYAEITDFSLSIDFTYQTNYIFYLMILLILQSMANHNLISNQP